MIQLNDQNLERDGLSSLSLGNIIIKNAVFLKIQSILKMLLYSIRIEVNFKVREIGKITVSNIIENMKLMQNHVSPCGVETEINFEVGLAGYVSLQIVDPNGRIICSLVSADIDAGTYKVKWDGNDDYRNIVASGTYLCKLKANDQTKIIKIAM